jgi:sulfoxide reductase catalytic subunit YedY
MLIGKPSNILSSEITPESVYLSRRSLLKGLGLVAGAASLPAYALTQPKGTDLPLYPGPDWLRPKLDSAKTTWSVDEELTPYDSVITYNNFYEFGLNKEDPYERAQGFNTDPWQVEILGEVERPGIYNLEDLHAKVDIEERIYRFRCVEAWSMVIPWLGFSLASLIKQLNPTSNAKYVEFVTLEDPEQMPGQRSLFSTIDWPYREGLRMDEAMHPLTMLAVGVYGQAMPPQNGAPLRLVVPWKYGFKSIKSIVQIRFRESMPQNTWRLTASQEYGFYANVNPNVDHPRWSQATERRLPSSLFNPRIIETQMFNGYEEVAPLYAGMDLSKWY